MELRQRALRALQTSDIQGKVDQSSAIWSQFASFSIANDDIPEPPGLPGRPAQPNLVAPTLVPQRSPFTVAGRAALIHAICHIEFNAINLALDAVWRFAGMPADFYRDWMRVAFEEAQHFTLLHDHLQSLGHHYGDFPPTMAFGKCAKRPATTSSPAWPWCPARWRHAGWTPPR
jgi:uncharacterized ferritin-like protein (DUF455 family)